MRVYVNLDYRHKPDQFSQSAAVACAWCRQCPVHQCGAICTCVGPRGRSAFSLPYLGVCRQRDRCLVPLLAAGGAAVRRTRALAPSRQSLLEQQVNDRKQAMEQVVHQVDVDDRSLFHFAVPQQMGIGDVR